MLRRAVKGRFLPRHGMNEITDLADNVIEKDKMELRAEKNKLFMFFLRIV